MYAGGKQQSRFMNKMSRQLSRKLSKNIRGPDVPAEKLRQFKISSLRLKTRTYDKILKFIENHMKKIL